MFHIPAHKNTSSPAAQAEIPAERPSSTQPTSQESAMGRVKSAIFDNLINDPFDLYDYEAYATACIPEYDMNQHDATVAYLIQHNCTDEQGSPADYPECPVYDWRGQPLTDEDLDDLPF